MAALNKHGKNIRIDKLFYSIAYCSDNKVLINHGSGWKIYGTLKPGRNWEIEGKKVSEKYKTSLEKDPTQALFIKKMKEYIPKLYNRYWFKEYLRAMPKDPDGIYAEIQDSTLYDYKRAALRSLSFKEIAELCRLASTK